MQFTIVYKGVEHIIFVEADEDYDTLYAYELSWLEERFSLDLLAELFELLADQGLASIDYDAQTLLCQVNFAKLAEQLS